MVQPIADQGTFPSARVSPETHHKDAVLDDLADSVNVAQFVSFGPDPDLTIRFCRIAGTDPGSPEEAVAELLARSSSGTVNVRSFVPTEAKGHEFVYGLESVDAAFQTVRRMQASGLHTIVNETIDTHDGGVSGVVFGGVCEFAPDDTPRAVEKPGTASLSLPHALKLFETVYGFVPSLEFPPVVRVEFSIHPVRCGYRHEHTIVWERETFDSVEIEPQMSWPNRFSRHIGDKAFGLLIADIVGLPVPRATVIARRVAPFSFGTPTGATEVWLRTCPVEQRPGLFTTTKGWVDPYELLAREDPKGSEIASVISQEGVDATYSGALLSHEGGSVTVEGVRGRGDDFMVGRRGPEALPENVTADVEAVVKQASTSLGPVRLEWSHDGRRCWVLQLHRGATPGRGSVIFPGEVQTFHEFNVDDGIEALRKKIAELDVGREGIALVGNVGLTSHFGDLLRRGRVPSVLRREL